MEQRSNDAAVKDAQIKLELEECVKSMEQRSNYAALKDVQIIPSEEEYVGDTEQTATITTNQLFSHHVLVDQNLIRLLRLILISVRRQLQQAKAVCLERWSSYVELLQWITMRRSEPHIEDIVLCEARFLIIFIY